jgi:signal transduction histidine kinase
MPSQRVLLIFYLVGLLCLTMLGWWILYQVEQTGQMVEIRGQEMRARRFEAEHALAGRTDLASGPIEGFPDLVLRPPSEGEDPGPRIGGLEVAVRPERIAELNRWHERRLIMFVSEGTFFIGLLLAGLGLIYLTLRHEVLLQRQQSNFVAAVTHELKSPLSSLRLYLETMLLGRVREPAAQERHVQKMLSDVDRLEQLIENLLDAGRLDRKGLHLKFEEVWLEEHLAAWIEEMAPTLERHCTKLVSDLESGIFVRIDPEALRTVFRNLVDNAVKYGGAAPRVEVHLRAEGREGRLEVRDHGIGVERAELERIFERFYRVGDEMVRSVRGTGLGLYLVREIVQAQGGRVFAESAGRGQGLAVIVCLPLVEPQKAVKEGPRS